MSEHDCFWRREAHLLTEERDAAVKVVEAARAYRALEKSGEPGSLVHLARTGLDSSISALDSRSADLNLAKHDE